MDTDAAASRRPLWALVALVLVEVAAVAGLTALARAPWAAVDTGDLGWWLAATPPPQVLAALARIVAMVAAWWLLATTCLSAAVATRRGSARWLSRLTPALVRRVAGAGVGVVLGVGVTAPAMAAPPPAPALGAMHAPTPSPMTAPATPSRPAAAQPVPSRPAAARYVVRPGDSLWRIAARQVRSADGAHPDLAEVTRYWRRLVAANRGHLASGDPDLIHPGEQVVLPPIE